MDLVIAGHSHLYERFRPLASEYRPGEWPITYVTAGGGGAPLHTALPNPALVAHEATNHFVVFEATPDTLRATAVRADGSILDRFEIRKVRGQPSPDYLAQVYPEEAVELCRDVMPSLAGRAAALPTPDKPAPVMLTVRPRSQSAPIARLEIHLTPASAVNYELENAPLRLTTPPPGTTNTVWVSVRATGQSKVRQNKDHDLVPPLLFQAEVSAADGVTIAYGAKGRFTTEAALEWKDRQGGATTHAPAGR